MGPFRALQVSIVILMLFGSTWLVRVVGMAAAPSGSSTTWLSSRDALAGVLEQGNSNDNDDGDNDDGDEDDNDNDGGGDDNDNDGGGDDNDNDFDDNENFDDFDVSPPPSSSAPVRRQEPVCSTTGQDTVFTSHDDRVTVRVFASTSSPVRIEIYKVIDFLSAPLPPGNLVGLLAYEIRASSCDTNPLAQLPAEANMGIRYTDIEATGLDQSRLVIGRLDMSTATWTPLEKRANDPSANYVAATIIETGFYMVWEMR